MSVARVGGYEDLTKEIVLMVRYGHNPMIASQSTIFIDISNGAFSP